MSEDTRRLQYLHAMGIQSWRQRAPREITMGMDDRSAALTPPVPLVSHCDSAAVWDALQRTVAACTACPLHRTRTQTVFGVGDHHASCMVIGEAPGEREDLKGEPFVGKAGMLLNEMLQAMGLKREEVYISNILKCRPPQNRDPKPEEAASCEPFLKQQVGLVQPQIIVAVGRIAAQNLLKTQTPIGRLRGKVHYYANIPLVVTYHPAYLLRSLLDKRKAWDDLKLAMKVLRQARSD